MTERQMEDLIAQFPEEFLGNHQLTLKGRQQSFAEVCRFDLLFTDSHGTTILMELKAVPAKYDHAAQLAKYKDELERRGERNVLMWLIAPHIPNTTRSFLDSIGIEYSEIHEAQFRRFAERHGIAVEGTSNPIENANPVRATRAAPRTRPIGSESLYTLNQTFDKNELDRLLRSFDSVVRRDIDRSISRKIRQEVLENDPPYISRGTMAQLAKWCKTENPLYWDGMEVAQKMSQLLFGCRLDRSKLGV